MYGLVMKQVDMPDSKSGVRKTCGFDSHRGYFLTFLYFVVYLYYMARKQKTIHYIYKTTCLVTSRYYIGMHSTCNIDDGYMGSGKRLRYSIQKHGVDNHKKEIIEFFETRDLLIEAEKKSITPDMITDNNCMNLKEGGTGGFSSKEHRIKCITAGGEALKQKLINDENFLNEHIGRAIINLKKMNDNRINYVTFSGKSHSIETKQLIGSKNSIKQSGESNSQFGTCWITKDGVDKKIKKDD